MSSVRVLRGDRVVPAVDPMDRGLAYGDGVFETLLVHQGEPVWWDAHWARLRRGADVLGFAAPDAGVVRAHCHALVEGAGRAVLKIIATRGAGGRGYRPPAAPEPCTVLSLHPAPDVPASLNLRWCRTRLARQPALAGIKHLNRLEQVLARDEWQDPDVHDGLMLDEQGHVVCATSANVFILEGERWLTPAVDACGIAGLMRAWVLSTQPRAGEAQVTAERLLAADAVFLCNAVRGILPVQRLDARDWPDHPAVAQLRRQLADRHPAFEPRED